MFNQYLQTILKDLKCLQPWQFSIHLQKKNSCVSSHLGNVFIVAEIEQDI